MLGWPFWGFGIRQDRSRAGIWGGGARQGGEKHGPALSPGLHGPPEGRQGRAASIVSPSRAFREEEVSL